MDYYCPVSPEQPSEPRVDGRSLRAGRVRESNKSDIISSAAELLATHRGSSITVRMIAERAEVSIATVYNHFPGSTSEIFIEVGNRLINDAAKLTGEVLEAEGPVAAAEFLPVAVCAGVVKLGAGCFDMITSRQVGGAAFFGEPDPETTMFNFLVASGLDSDHRTRDAARTIGYLVRGAIFAFASHATTNFDSDIATTEDELMSVAGSAVRTSLGILGINWPPADQLI